MSVGWEKIFDYYTEFKAIAHIVMETPIVPPVLRLQVLLVLRDLRNPV
jgi:hypothetical protein